MENKSPRNDTTSNVVLPPLPTSARAGTETVEARRNKLKSIFAMMSNVTTGDREGGGGGAGGYSGLMEEETRGKGVLNGVFSAGGMARSVSGGGRAMVTPLKGSCSLPDAVGEHGRAAQGIDRTLSSMSRTLRLLLRDLDHTQDKVLPREVEALIEEGHQRYWEGLHCRSRHGGSDGLLVVGNDRDSLEWRLQLQRARTAAADEVYSLEQSVADYSAAPPMPREGVASASDAMWSLEMEAIADALRKIRESALAITELHNNVSLPWWSSPLRTRDMKIATIRLNYHARRALLWDWRCHNQLLIRATQLNHLTNGNGVELIKLQENLRTFLKLIDWSKMNTATLTKEMVGLQEQLREANIRREELQSALLAECRELRLVPVSFPPEGHLVDKNDEESEENGAMREPASNAPVAELALLLLRHTWPEELREDVERVREWLRTVPTVLE
ncbi:unnamed protein product [Phytomonas sp. EM1]|nr:unnamed protein product [Phytomonas sp. EM1]|eukprot:CCW62865.1 unnamed protein product [Phytomonas sp. isolate EM1]